MKTKISLIFIFLFMQLNVYCNEYYDEQIRQLRSVLYEVARVKNSDMTIHLKECKTITLELQDGTIRTYDVIIYKGQYRLWRNFNKSRRYDNFFKKNDR